MTEPKPKPKPTIVLDAENKQRLTEATARLDRAEHELTLTMEALTLPETGADNVMVSERLRAALTELSAARQALALVVAAIP